MYTPRIPRFPIFFCSFFVFLIILAPTPDLAGADFSFRFLPGEKFKVIERSDLRHYKNGTFFGLTYRENRGIYTVTARENNQFALEGTYYRFEETKHDNRAVAKEINHSTHVSFTMGINGSYIHTDPDIYPRLQSFPVFPSESVQPGESWTAYGTRMVDPFRDGTYTRVRFLCRYHYQGKQTIYGGEHAVVHAQYALRYRRGDDPDGDTRIHEISGTHQATLYIDLSNGIPTFMRERVNEHYSLEGDETIGFKGFVLTWWKPVITLEKARLVENLEKELSERGVSDVGVSEHDQGVALNINKIHFIADKAQVLPEEEDRLTELARTLARIEERTIKVVGHTARVGTEESQYRLSVERAKTIVDYLSENGINSKRLIYEGKGGSEPIAPNDTEENMAKNRRVEIIIMED